MNKDKGRKTRGEVSPDPSQSSTKPCTHLFPVGSFLAACLLSFPPAFFLSSCNGEDPPAISPPADATTEILTRAPLSEELSSLHVFVYNDDSLRRLDSYHEFNPGDDKLLRCTSRSGKKIFAAVANLDVSGMDWREISSFEALEKLMADFREEDPDYPVMTGIVKAEAGNPVPLTMELKRLMSTIRITSVSADFKGREYDGAVIEDAKAYLININGRCEVFREGGFTQTEMVNFHSGEDSESLPHPEMVSCPIGDIGDSPFSPGISFYCYPNDTGDDTVSAPMTRLVIEGKVRGVRYFWPVNITVGRNLRYDVKISITRTGTDSPDLPADPASLEAVCSVAPWIERDEQVVSFRIRRSTMGERTKSTDPDENLITDLHLYIFNSDDLLEEMRYLKGSALKQDGNGVSTNVTLLRNARYSVYAVANAGYYLKGIKDKEDLLAFRYHLVYPDEFRTGIPMSGYVEDFRCGDKETLNLDLVRMMAKVSLKMDRTGLDQGVKVIVRSVQVGGCPNSAKLFGKSKAETVRDVFSSGFDKTWKQLDPLNADKSLGISGEVGVYMLENIQGDLLEGNTSQENKVFPDGDLHAKVCSYLELKMEYYSPSKNTAAGKYLIYRFFLGEGPGNFDVVRNCHYHYTVKVSGDGLSGTGWRVDKSALE